MTSYISKLSRFFPVSFVMFQTLSQIIKRWSYLVISVLLLNKWSGNTHIGCYYSDRVKLLIIQIIVLKKKKIKNLQARLSIAISLSN